MTVSVGLSYCKFLAKLASDLDKPRGFAVIAREEAKAWLAPQSVGRLWGVGRVGRERLERLGFRIDRRSASASTSGQPLSRLGDDGLRLWRLAQGRDDRAGGCRARDQKRFERDDLRLRHQRQGGAHAHLACPMRSGRDAAAQGGPLGLRGDAEIAPARFLSAHPQPRRLEGDAACAATVRGGAPACSTPSPTASPIASWGSPRPTSRRPSARTRRT